MGELAIPLALCDYGFTHFCFPFPNSRTGQTQSQYLNFGDSQTEGKADAEITRYGSRASVCE